MAGSAPGASTGFGALLAPHLKWVVPILLIALWIGWDNFSGAGENLGERLRNATEVPRDTSERNTDIDGGPIVLGDKKTKVTVGESWRNVDLDTATPNTCPRYTKTSLIEEEWSQNSENKLTALRYKAKDGAGVVTFVIIQYDPNSGKCT